jgi:GT2 family glycosyltransferase
VSAVIVTRDRPGLLADALRSVELQDLAPRETRIGDDGVPPLATLPDFSGLEVTWLHTGGVGAAAARNAAARGARGAVLAFLDDDDRWRPDHLSGLAAAFDDPEVSFAWRDCRVVREEVEGVQRHDRQWIEIARDWDPAMMRDNDYLPPSSWGIRRELFERLGGFDEAFEFSEDWDLVLRVAALTTPRRVPGVTVEVRLRASGNASADMGAVRLDCLRRLAARHALPELEPRTFWEVAQHAACAPGREADGPPAMDRP